MQHSHAYFTPQETTKLLRLMESSSPSNLRLALNICEGAGTLPYEIHKKIGSDPQLILYCLEEGYQNILACFRFLYIRWSNLRSIPPNIHYLSAVLMLDLAYNQITEVNSALFQLKQLKKLFLHKNHLTSLSSEITKLVHLEELDLSANRLEHLPVEIRDLPLLKKIILSENPLHRKEIDQLRNRMPDTDIEFES